MAACARCGRSLQVHFAHGKYEAGPKRGEPREPTRKFKCNHKRGNRPCPSSSSFGLQEDILDTWIIAELAPILVAEMQEIRASVGRNADVETLARLDRKLADAKKRETMKLTAMVDALDSEQYAAVAAQRRAEREELGRQVKAIRSRLENADRILPDLSESSLTTMQKSALKDALSRAISFIAIGKAGTGIVVHTRWGSYIGARYRKGIHANRENPLATYIETPTAAAALECMKWITDPDEFVLGRRDSLGKSAIGLSNEELLPGFLALDEPYILTDDIPIAEGE